MTGSESASELVWPHHGLSPDLAEMCDQSGLPAGVGRVACDRGHELEPIAVVPLIPLAELRTA